LGCGDGRIIVEAAQSFGATSVGIEKRRDLAIEASGKAKELNLSRKMGVIVGDFYSFDISRADVVVSYLPVGSEMATKWYAEQVIEAGCAFVNCIPVFIASSEYWGKRFKDAGLPLLGDDIKSQVGATIVHRVLTSLFVDRGVKIDRTYQLNFGGNTDFLNMLERERLESKKISKTGAVTSMIPYQMDPDNVHVGPSDHVPWLTDRKWCYIRMEGTTFGNVPLNVEVKLEVWDSPNSAGVVIDAIRCAKLALDRGLSGPVVGPSSYFFKTPPRQFRDDVCREKTEAFIQGAV
jgi:myo-inositol-1-phosphate synthase